ncbi:MAG TPA: DUF177 domain-containing protein [Armatimonadota bacterium]|nr:DUF177 domain-containing protein [Armatimonadota bacterium]
MSLKIDLANIAGMLGARGRYSVSENVAQTDDPTCSGQVAGELQVENTGSLLLLRGELHGSVGLTCVRCLGAVERPITIRVEEEFATEDTEPDVATMDRDEPDASAMSDYVLDVSEFVRQQLLVNLPMAALCREDCRGICPKCGQNLNEKACDCAAEPVDSRWAKLGDLLQHRLDRKND